MSPAGYCKAGADAVYLGLDQFSARAKVGFTQEELPEAMAGYANAESQRLIRSSMTRNSMRRADAGRFGGYRPRCAHRAGPDCASGARSCPELEIHGSTQISIANAEGVRLAQYFARCSRKATGQCAFPTPAFRKHGIAASVLTVASTTCW